MITEADSTHSYILTVETDIFEENVTNSNQLCAYMMNTSATEMYDGREIYSVRELTILPENVNSQRARVIGNVSIKLPSPEQVIILDYRRTSQTEPVTTTTPVTTTRPVTTTPPEATTRPVTTPAHEITTSATVAPTPQPASTTSPVTVQEVRTTASPVTTTATEQTTTQPGVNSTVQPTTQLTAQPIAQPTATVQSAPDSPAPDSCEETAPVMGERAFYRKR